MIFNWLDPEVFDNENVRSYHFDEQLCCFILHA